MNIVKNIERAEKNVCRDIVNIFLSPSNAAYLYLQTVIVPINLKHRRIVIEVNRILIDKSIRR